MSRHVEVLPPGWVGPADAANRSLTTLGNLASPRTAVVDQRGLVTPWVGGWSLDWWIGADDRWHFPSSDAGVRQRLVDGTPVVETAMRIPGGDAVHRAYVVRASGPGELDEWLVVEVHNDSRVPFALALAVRPYNTDGLALVAEVGLVGETVTVNTKMALVLPGQPRLMAGSTFARGDSASVVTSGGATETVTWPVRCPSFLAQAAFLYPLAHTATLRVAMPLSPDGGIESYHPSRLPSAADAARGWKVMTKRGLRLDLPPGRLGDAIEANRRYLLLYHAGPAGPAGPAGHPAPPWREVARAVVALDQHGFHAEAAELLARALDTRRPRPLGAAMRAVAEHGRLSGQTDLKLSRIQRARHRSGAEPPGADAPDRDELGHLQRLLDAASPTWTWPDGPAATTEFCSLVRNLLVRDTPGGLVLLTLWPDSWLGQALEVRDAPTHAGLLSFAVRWHGDRPALLWELQRRDPTLPTRLRVPGLDPSWTTDAPAGEALLAPRGLRES